MQKPTQDIYTCGLFISFVLLIIFSTVRAMTVLEQTGMVHADSSLAFKSVDSMDTLDEDILSGEDESINECEVIYHRASQGSVYLDGYPYLVTGKEISPGAGIRYTSTDEETEDDMGELYYALYTCSGTSVIAEGYI